MSEIRSMTKMGWEEHYLDNSGVEYAVYFDANALTNEGVGRITFESTDIAQFPQSKVNWLIECLTKIKEEQGL